MDQKNQEVAIIVGAGPAGLTAAYELLDKTNIKPVILEKSEEIGGISRTVNYKGNRIDIGGHRFFSKSDKIMNWWINILPLQGPSVRENLSIEKNNYLKNNICQSNNFPDPEKSDKLMLNRNRVSRILFTRKFFDYPISLNYNTLHDLGIERTAKIGISYLKTVLNPIDDEKSLEEFFINRFGRELYLTFFKDYTEKVWGVPCNRIKADWGSQRIKGLSIKKTLYHSLMSEFSKKSLFSQKKVETSLIGEFMYPKFGPGQMWEEVARKIVKNGGEIYLNHKVVGIKTNNNNVTCVKTIDGSDQIKNWEGNHFLSSMPVKELIESFNEVPIRILEVARGLVYRDLIVVGLLLKQLKIKNQTKTKTINDIVPDNWIYIQERDLKLGRVQIFNNWSPYLVKDSNNVWLGLEYFCNEGDKLWKMSDIAFKDFAIDELVKLGFINTEDIIDNLILKVEKTYPAYFGSYDKFNLIREFSDRFTNLYLIGRNGMHRYNNMDHSMLTAMTAVDNIINGVKSKENIWNINAEEDYQE